MSVRVVARIRPLLKSELDKDVIVSAVSAGSETPSQPTVVRIPNPKNDGENFNFQFNSVYGKEATQQDIFDNEVSPTTKHLFNGFDVTLFAYGVTGTGKTHTMRGGKSLVERGMIPRLLSGIYRRSRKIEKDSKGETTVNVTMSYYEIYNDKVFDLFEAPEKRSMTGLQLRDNGGKTVVVGLTERPCESLKEFERLYDQANVNRSTSATKLNAHSSRSHAVLCVRLAVTTGDQTRISTASAIDLAGSEDNRRTENGKERLVESASINKSLFVLAQCVEAISKKQSRIPYRESKMTRILSLGQNNGLTIMILNIAPVKSYHLDTLSSLNFANRTKRIEVREVENEPIYRGCTEKTMTFTGSTIQRQPLRPLASTVHNSTVNSTAHPSKTGDKPAKAFSVYTEMSKPRKSSSSTQARLAEAHKRSSPLKRPSDSFASSALRPSKVPRSSPAASSKTKPAMSQATIEDMIEKKVSEILATRALDQPSIAPGFDISDEVKRRLDSLEQKIDSKDDSRAEGLTFLLMAKQHYVRGELTSALKMYELAKEYFPNNVKLDTKILKLREVIREKKTLCSGNEDPSLPLTKQSLAASENTPKAMVINSPSDKISYHVPTSSRTNPDHNTNSYASRPHSKPTKASYASLPNPDPPSPHLHRSLSPAPHSISISQTPRTTQLLAIINTRDMAQIRLLKGVGSRKAEVIVEALCAEDGDEDGAGDEDELGEEWGREWKGENRGMRGIVNLEQLGRLKGVGAKTVENMRIGLGFGV